MSSLVLSGAGAKIGLHIGFCEKLFEAKKNFSCFAGTSAGSLLASCFASEKDLWFVKKIFTKTDLNSLVLGKRRKVFSIIKLLLCGYVDNGIRFEKFLNSLFGGLTFSDIQKNLYIISYCIDTREVVVFCKEYTPDIKISDAVFASSCLPFVFKPKIIDGKRYVDGGIAKNFPIDLPFLEEPIYGNLVEPYKEYKKSIGPIGTFSFFKELFDSWFYANDVVSINDAKMSGKDLKITRSYYDIDTFTFDISSQDKEKMIEIGYNAAQGVLDGNFYI